MVLRVVNMLDKRIPLAEANIDGRESLARYNGLQAFLKKFSI
jgi:hypothetical protein